MYHRKLQKINLKKLSQLLKIQEKNQEKRQFPRINVNFLLYTKALNITIGETTSGKGKWCPTELKPNKTLKTQNSFAYCEDENTVPDLTQNVSEEIQIILLQY